MLSRAALIASAALLALFPAGVLSAREIGPGDDWRILMQAQSPEGTDTSFVMVNVGNMTIKGDRRVATVAAFDRSTARPVLHYGEAVFPSVVRWFVVADCKANTSRRATVYTHDWGGRVIDESEGTQPMTRPTPGTMGQDILDVVCGRKEGRAEPGAHPWRYLVNEPKPPRPN